MTTSLLIAAEEWRYWFRTKLGASAAFLALMLIGISISASLSQQAHEKNTRERLQVKAEQTFREQPARHPHRMVHYGHYWRRPLHRHRDVSGGASPKLSHIFTQL